MTIRVMFVASSVFALGEAIIAQSFARRLDPAAFSCSFVISQNAARLFEGGDYPYLILIGAQPLLNKVLLGEFVRVNQPDVIVLADYYTLAHSRACYGLDIETLRQYERPLISFDIYEWESSDFRVDFFDGRVKEMSRGISELPVHLRPCPLNRPGAGSEKYFPYSLFDPAAYRAPAPRRDLRARHGFAQGEKVVFMATAGWQSWLYQNNPDRRFGDCLPELYQLILDGLGCDLTLLHVGPEPLCFSSPRLNYRHLDFASPALFDDLLALSDLCLTNNVIATTLTKAVHFGVPAAMLGNSHSIESAEGIEAFSAFTLSDEVRALARRAGRVFPYRMAPLGWHRFVSRLLRDNAYLETFADLEILDVEGCRQTLVELLAESPARQAMEARQAGYLSGLKDLRAPGEVMRGVMEVCA
ncbi:DUF6365 family protein [Trichloromonas sp.]|uniref:DUF6365 family protein n=1 Tax=Trichloromonas sp. TaxID=3069249 RepID=UPI003D81BF12